MKIFALAAVALAALFALTACGKRDAEQEAQDATGEAEATELSNIPLGTEQAIRTVDSIFLTRDRVRPGIMTIRATGTAWSSGWTNAKLVAMDDAAAAGAVRSYRFVATSPSAELVRGTSRPMTASLRVEGFPAGVNSVRVVTENSEITAAVPPEPPAATSSPSPAQ